MTYSKSEDRKRLKKDAAKFVSLFEEYHFMETPCSSFWSKTQYVFGNMKRLYTYKNLTYFIILFLLRDNRVRVGITLLK